VDRFRKLNSLSCAPLLICLENWIFLGTTMDSILCRYGRQMKFVPTQMEWACRKNLEAIVCARSFVYFERPR
jgi:hypothetical protein